MSEPTSPLEHVLSPADRQLVTFAIGVTGHLKQKLNAALNAAPKIESDLARASQDEPQPVKQLAEARARVDSLDKLAGCT